MCRWLLFPSCDLKVWPLTSMRVRSQPCWVTAEQENPPSWTFFVESAHQQKVSHVKAITLIVSPNIFLLLLWIIKFSRDIPELLCSLSFMTVYCVLRPGMATIYGSPVAEIADGAEMKQLVGICPQFNIIFDVLTVEEHLRIFAAIKGILPSDIDGEVGISSWWIWKPCQLTARARAYLTLNASRYLLNCIHYILHFMKRWPPMTLVPSYSQDQFKKNRKFIATASAVLMMSFRISLPLWVV